MAQRCRVVERSEAQFRRERCTTSVKTAPASQVDASVDRAVWRGVPREIECGATPLLCHLPEPGTILPGQVRLTGEEDERAVDELAKLARGPRRSGPDDGGGSEAREGQASLSSSCRSLRPGRLSGRSSRAATLVATWAGTLAAAGHHDLCVGQRAPRPEAASWRPAGTGRARTGRCGPLARCPATSCPRDDGTPNSSTRTSIWASCRGRRSGRRHGSSPHRRGPRSPTRRSDRFGHGGQEVVENGLGLFGLFRRVDGFVTGSHHFGSRSLTNRAACQPGIENKSAYAWASGVTRPYRPSQGSGSATHISVPSPRSAGSGVGVPVESTRV